MADALPPEDGTTGLTDDFSDFSLDHFSSHDADPGASNADAYILEPSDFYGSTTTQPPPYDPKKPFVCNFQYPNGEMCYVNKPRQCDLT